MNNKLFSALQTTGHFITTTEAAKLLRLSRIRVIQLCAAGRLGEKIGGRYLITVEQVEAFAKLERKVGNPNIKKGK